MVLPIIVLIGIIYLVKKKLKKKIGLYLLTNIGGIVIVLSLLFGYIHITNKIASIKKDKEEQLFLQYVTDNYASDIYELYPNAKFKKINSYGEESNGVRVILENYNYTNQPDFDVEMNNWREILSKESFNNFNGYFLVEYHFNNEKEYFASFRTDYYDLHYYSGLSKEGSDIVIGQIKSYLSAYYPNAIVEDEYGYFTYHRLRVSINKKLNENDKQEEEKMWNNFINEYNINPEIVNITVTYKNQESSNYDCIYYDLEGKYWYGNYLED